MASGRAAVSVHVPTLGAWRPGRISHRHQHFRVTGRARSRRELRHRVRIRYVRVMLRGRTVQQATIDALLDQVRAGASGALVLRGEPGIGKTALLDYAASRASDQMPVLRAAGIESEAELPFAGLHQLTRPAFGQLDALPEPQRLALESAFGLTAARPGTASGNGAGDRFLAGLGALSLLAEIAPVLCLIDDTHWLDRASAEALLFAARRLHRDGIAMIFTTRDYPGAFQAPGLADVPLVGLDATAAAALLTDRHIMLPQDQRDLLIASTRGNPLALIELSVGWASPPAGAPLPVTGRVIDAFGHQIRSLPSFTRNGLLIAAADDSGDLGLLQQAGLVVAELEQAGRGAAARYGPAAAAAAYKRAAQLSDDANAKARRMTLAAEAMLDSGQHQAARTLAERAAPDTADAGLTVRLLQVRAFADVADGAMVSAYTLNMAGAAVIAGSEPERSLWMLMEAHQAIRQAPYDHARIAATLDRLDAAESGHRPLAWLIRWNAAMVLDQAVTAYPPLDEVLTQVRADAAEHGPRAQVIAAAGACLAGRDDAMAGMAADLIAQARPRGDLGALPGGLSQLCWAQTMLGSFRDARVSAAEGRQLSLDLGYPFWADWMTGTLAYLAAVEGDEEQCREYAAQVRATAESAAAAPWAEAALILLDLGCGRVADALARLEAAAAGPAWHHPNITRMAPDQVEAAVRLGRPASAADALARFTRWAPLVGQPWAAALQARCQALTASDTDAEPHYLQALRHHDDDTRPFDQARSQLVYGEWLRRARRKREARAQLLAALNCFEELGARPWAARARAELTATGTQVPRAAAPDILASLTPQELQITRLAARGLQNRDIAAQLFLSPRTVAYHLYKAYPKLGVSSRAELPALV